VVDLVAAAKATVPTPKVTNGAAAWNILSAWDCTRLRETASSARPLAERTVGAVEPKLALIENAALFCANAAPQFSEAA